MASSRIGSVLTLLLLAAITVALAPIVTASGPDLQLRPGYGEPGETVVAHGRGFPPGATGSVAMADHSRTLGEFAADNGGSFKIAFTVPNISPGNYVIVAVAPGSHAIDTLTIGAPGERHDDPSTPDDATPERNRHAAESTPTFDCTPIPAAEVTVAAHISPSRIVAL